MYLIGDGITLRSIEEQDLEMLRNLINNPDIERATMGFNFPLSEYHQKKWFHNLENNSNSIRWIIDIENKGAIGLCVLDSIDWKNRVAKIGIKLDSKQESKGIGGKAYDLVIKYAFEELQLNRIESEVISYNEASIKLHQKFNFVKEGIKRSSIYQKGKYYDTIIFSLLKNEFF